MSIANMASTKRTITDEDRAAARRLRGYWHDYKQRNKGISQENAGSRIGFSQAVFSQYLLCTIPLGFEATVKFARLLGVKPEEIRPDMDFSGVVSGEKLQQQMAKYSLAAAVGINAAEDKLLYQLIDLYGQLSQQCRDKLLSEANWLHAMEHPDSSPSNPFGKKRKHRAGISAGS